MPWDIPPPRQEYQRTEGIQATNDPLLQHVQLAALNGKVGHKARIINMSLKTKACAAKQEQELSSSSNFVFVLETPSEQVFPTEIFVYAAAICSPRSIRSGYHLVPTCHWGCD
jgi:hypothetical protein